MNRETVEFGTAATTESEKKAALRRCEPEDVGAAHAAARDFVAPGEWEAEPIDPAAEPPGYIRDDLTFPQQQLIPFLAARSSEALSALPTEGAGLAADHAQAGRSLSHHTKIQFNRSLMLGDAYIAKLDLMPGDEFEIKLGRKQIRLVPMGSPY